MGFTTSGNETIKEISFLHTENIELDTLGMSMQIM